MAASKQEKDAAPNVEDSFQHTPLGSDEIRLLRVDLDDQSRELSLNLETFERDEAPEYQAISYTWEKKPYKHKTITLNDKPFEVTQNAFWCLWFICKHYRRWQYIWIDSTYGPGLSECGRVLAWIGCEQQIHGDVWSTNLGKRYKPFDTRLPNDLIGLPYWRRIWVLQEIYFAKKMTFLYGPVESDRRDMWESAIIIDMLHSTMGGWDDVEGLSGALSTYAVFVKDEKLSLLASIWWFQYHDCSDPRDRVYAIMGLLPPPERQAFAKYFPDYNISLEKCWLVVFAHLLLWHGLSEDVFEDGHIRINITVYGHGKPDVGRDHAIWPPENIETALLPMIRQAKQLNPSEASVTCCRRLRKSNQHCDRSCEEKRQYEYRSQQDLMHKIIAEFPR